MSRRRVGLDLFYVCLRYVLSIYHTIFYCLYLCVYLSLSIRADSLEFLAWLLNQLHAGTANKPASRPDSRSIVTDGFQGRVEVHTLKKTKTAVAQQFESSYEELPFFYLSLDLPVSPLFRNHEGELVIPQVPINMVITNKYNGSTYLAAAPTSGQTSGTSEVVSKRCRIQKLPEYLVLHLKRFEKNKFFLEKNPTIITFPVKNLEMKDFMFFEDGKKVPTDASQIHNYTDRSTLVSLIKYLTDCYDDTTYDAEGAATAESGSKEKDADDSAPGALASKDKSVEGKPSSAKEARRAQLRTEHLKMRKLASEGSIEDLRTEAVRRYASIDMQIFIYLFIYLIFYCFCLFKLQFRSSCE
jgi:hypothetical protein